jgi:peptide/nickel transport system permease protein
MRYGHLVRRLALFLIVLWAAATFNFLVPRLAPNRDPIQERLMQMAAQGGYQQQGIAEMVKAYKAKFGLDRPLWVQYLNYLGDMVRFDFGPSMALYPTKVADLILNAIPWTIGLLTVATLLAFLIGTLFGSIIAWPRSPRVFKYLLSPLMAMSAIPYYLFGLVLVYIFAVGLKLFPIAGGYSTGTAPSATPSFILNVLHHSVLPAFSIVISAIGFWALGMRGMMVTVQGEGYMFLAEANGLKPRNIFYRYALRNAILPQFTALALSLGFIVSGSILVEVIFTYPGIGSVLYRAISTADYFTIYGVVFIIILSIGLATLIIDLVYPLLDPRISTRRA